MNPLLPFVEPRSQQLESALERLATSGNLEERGAVFTKAGVVAAILDLCGYTPAAPLVSMRLLEPSFGDGDFLLAAIERLLQVFVRLPNPSANAVAQLSDCIRGVELHRDTYERTVTRATRMLVEVGLDLDAAEELLDTWLINDDFLLAEIEGPFDFVVGNPPYVRQERIPDILLSTYKRKYATLYDRADLYVLFFERGLDLLGREGVLGYICANRWVKNKYGGPLRQKVGSSFHLQYYIDLERADSFHAEVIAYPVITVIRRSAERQTLVALGNRESASGLDATVTALKRAATDNEGLKSGTKIARLSGVVRGSDPWILDAPKVLGILRALESDFSTLEEVGVKVGIGVATGADRVFIGDYDALPVEEDRKLRLAMAADCATGRVRWGGRGVVNPYLESGTLARFEDYPLFASYMEEHGDALKRRHTAKQRPSGWYKTIDRIYPRLTAQPKLLIPDIKGDAAVAYDDGVCYPHHNLYVITSEEWDLRALQAILQSSVALMFVAAYCVKMSGGFLRFQAQYLRRIRCPRWSDLSESQRRSLSKAAAQQDHAAIDSVVLPLFGLTGADALAVQTYAAEARVLKKNT